MKVIRRNKNKFKSIALVALLIAISVNQFFSAVGPVLAFTNTSVVDLFSPEKSSNENDFTYKIVNPTEDKTEAAVDTSASKQTTPKSLIVVTPTATPLPTVIPTSVTYDSTPGYNEGLASGFFDDATGSWVSGWNREGDGISLDSSSQGTSGTNSVHFVTSADSTVSYLYSEKFAIDSAKTYQWNQFIKAIGPGNELNFYIDEYNAYGDWVSGQWKGKLVAESTGEKSFNYIPTTNIVRSVRLQYYSTQGSTNDIYLDTVSFTKITQ